MEVTKEYPGSQQVLYLATDTIIANVRKRLDQFHEFKNLYTETFLQSVEQKRTNAMMLADEAARTYGHESVRAELVLVAAVCLKRFRSLKRYIATAYPSNPSQALNSAGWGYYTDASNQSWADVSSLCEASIKFIGEHLSELTAGNNMPVGFQQMFIDSFDIYTTTFKLFDQRLQAARTGTESKLVANNDLYHTVMDYFCLDGQNIFEDSFAISREYSYEAVSEMLAPSGPSSLVVETVKDEDGVMVPMSSVEISIVGTDIHETTNAAGRAEANRIANGPIKVRATADGFEDRLIDVTLDGTRKHLKIVMVPLFEGEMTVGASPEAGSGSMETAAAGSNSGSAE
jgi:hypothetical protein